MIDLSDIQKELKQLEKDNPNIITRNFKGGCSGEIIPSLIDRVHLKEKLKKATYRKPKKKAG